MSKFKRRVSAGDVLPRGYGIAWTERCSDSAIAMPMPFNAVVAGWLRLVRIVRYAWRGPTAYDRAFFDGFMAGREAERMSRFYADKMGPTLTV